MYRAFFCAFLVIQLAHPSLSRLEEGIFETTIPITTDIQLVAFQRTAFSGTKLEIKIKCDKGPRNLQLKVGIPDAITFKYIQLNY